MPWKAQPKALTHWKPQTQDKSKWKSLPVTPTVWGMAPTSSAPSSIISIAAAMTISALRCIVTLGGLAYVASSNDTTQANAILGISITAVNAGGQCSVQIGGLIIDSSFNWQDKKPIFCASDGSLTQTPITTGFIQQVGIPKSPTSFEISLNDATIRA